MIIEPGKISPHFSTHLRVEVGKGLAFKVNLEGDTVGWMISQVRLLGFGLCEDVVSRRLIRFSFTRRGV